MLIVGEFPEEAVEDETDGNLEDDFAENSRDSMVGGAGNSYTDVVSSTVDLKKEIAALREILQSEIASLKEELRKGGSD